MYTNMKHMTMKCSADINGCRRFLCTEMENCTAYCNCKQYLCSYVFRICVYVMSSEGAFLKDIQKNANSENPTLCGIWVI